MAVDCLLPDRDTDNEVFCTVSLPWLGAQSDIVIHSLHEAAQDLGPGRGKWNFYVPETDVGKISERFAGLTYCFVEPIGERYVESLMHSQSAIIYGGYNSVLDVLAAGLPTLVILRSTRDGEQPDHLMRLREYVGANMQIIHEEHVASHFIKESLPAMLTVKQGLSAEINLSGAERTARRLQQILKESV